MRGYVIVLYTFAIYLVRNINVIHKTTTSTTVLLWVGVIYIRKLTILLQVQGSHAFLPKFVYRVSKCPDPNNITEWEEASRKLVCLHPIRGGSSKQLSRVYHCLPSIFLNESVEYCGFSGAVTKGIVYYSALNSGRNIILHFVFHFQIIMQLLLRTQIHSLSHGFGTFLEVTIKIQLIRDVIEQLLDMPYRVKSFFKI